MQNKTFLSLSKKKQVLSGIGITSGAIGLFTLLNKKGTKVRVGWKNSRTNECLELGKNI